MWPSCFLLSQAYLCYRFLPSGEWIIARTNALINDETKAPRHRCVRHRLITIYNTHCKKTPAGYGRQTPGGRNSYYARIRYILGGIRTPDDGNVNDEFDLRFPPLSNLPRAQFHHISPHLLCKIPRATRAIIQIVHRTSYFVHGRRQPPPSYIVHRTWADPVCLRRT